MFLFGCNGFRCEGDPRRDGRGGAASVGVYAASCGGEYNSQYDATICVVFSEMTRFFTSARVFSLVLKIYATTVPRVTLLMSRARNNPSIPLSAAVHTNAIDFIDNSGLVKVGGEYGGGGGPQALVAGPPAYLQIDKVIYVPQATNSAPSDGSAGCSSRVATRVVPFTGVREKVDAFMAASPPKEATRSRFRSGLHSCADDACCNYDGMDLSSSRTGLSARGGAADDGVTTRLSELRARLAAMESRAASMSDTGSRAASGSSRALGARGSTLRALDLPRGRRTEMSSRLSDTEQASTQSSGSRRIGGRR